MILLIILRLLAPMPSYGYVLEGPHILDIMISNFKAAKTLRVQQKTVVWQVGISQKLVELDETLSFIYPGQFRSDARYEDTNRIFVVSHGHALTVVDEKIVSKKEGRYDKYKDPLLYFTRTKMLKALLSLGVDIGITSLGRFDDKVAYVIGANYPDTSVSQLWVDKESFLPLRLLVVNKRRGVANEFSKIEFIYKNWQKFKKFWYPMLIETYHNHKLIRRMNVRNVKVNESFSKDLMNLRRLSTLYSEERKQPVSPPSDEIDEMQQVIDEFKKKFEP
ncbi:MAG: hypothetical protein GY874_10045 [Desulfobacteraceae bacterium]|nr:hypothetical protein [Desulfobacteraceae bacterium]